MLLRLCVRWINYDINRGLIDACFGRGSKFIWLQDENSFIKFNGTRHSNRISYSN